MDFPLLTVAIIMIGLLLLAPIILKVVRSSLNPFADALGNSSAQGGAVASANVSYVLGVFVNFWDGVILLAFLITVILLFVSAYLIDASPFFIVLYVLMLIFTVLFAPSVLDVVNTIYEANDFAQEVALLGFLDLIRLNFGIIVTILGILSMVVIYAKVRFSE